MDVNNICTIYNKQKQKKRFSTENFIKSLACSPQFQNTNLSQCRIPGGIFDNDRDTQKWENIFIIITVY